MERLRWHGVSLVNDYPTQVFRKYLRKDEKFRETVFACSYIRGPGRVFFILKKGRKSRDIVPLTSNDSSCAKYYTVS